MPLIPTAPQLAYSLVGPDDASPLVFINGVGGAQAAFALQVKAFGGPLQVLTYDHRGIGASAHGAESPRVSDYADDLCRLLEHLGLAPAAVVGMSFGGRVALELALSWPERVAALVLSGTSGGGPRHDPGDSSLRDALTSGQALDAETWREVIAPALFGERYRRRYPRRIRGLARWRERHPVDPRAVEDQRSALEEFDVSQRLGAIRVPTLVLHGAEDRISPVSNARLLASGITGAQLEILDEVGHSPNVEAPDDFNRHIRAFLSSALGWALGS